MKTNDSIPADVRDEVIELGVASIETKGAVINTEGFGGLPMPGISEE
ncbi:benenodin family lasso peptide [Luteimonas sp. YGD11-2]|nr:benenodin family lasso peptide [Luteimonas sp. YGD11-2]